MKTWQDEIGAWKWPRGLKAKLQRRAGTKVASCSLCYSQQRVAIHHIHERGALNSPYIDNKGEPKFNPDDLILLCGSCHAKVHSCMNWGANESPFMITFWTSVKAQRLIREGVE